MNLEGVDLPWVQERLREFVTVTQAVGLSTPGYITARTKPACGREQAIELTETILPILSRLYPDWRTENETSEYDEFLAERDAARRLIARLNSYEEVTTRLGSGDMSPRLTAASLHHLIWRAAESQWSLGQRHEAVLAAAKTVNSQIQAKVRRRDLSDRRLVQEAFSEKPPEIGKPRLRFSQITQDETRESMRHGAMNFGAGCFSAIRNPLGHLSNDEIELDEQTALEQLAALSLFARWVDQADLEEA
ncbi:TIGR02391 family protein [Williamsia muralis]|uniref:TIGR02391 family protein n=1 Tax=Williamsia marianensis TaxID=85044 RepID=UPI000DE6052E|nr:TIGR02391 family protein [Williamsia marianensis]PVY34222.1 uncharacterized protein Ymh [Williamsia marianensis]